MHSDGREWSSSSSSSRTEQIEQREPKKQRPLGKGANEGE